MLSLPLDAGTLHAPHHVFLQSLVTRIPVDPRTGCRRFQVKDNTGKYADVLTPDGKPILRYMYERDTSDDAKTFDTAKFCTCSC